MCGARRCCWRGCRAWWASGSLGVLVAPRAWFEFLHAACARVPPGARGQRHHGAPERPPVALELAAAPLLAAEPAHAAALARVLLLLVREHERADAVDAAHQVQAAALELGRLENPKALDPLIAALSDAFSGVRAAAKESLTSLGWVPFGVRRSPDAAGLDRWILRKELSPKSLTQPQLDVMSGAIGHEDPNLRRALCEAFATLADPAAKPFLQKLLKDNDPSVVAAANAALATL